jgi:hypothetical protein
MNVAPRTFAVTCDRPGTDAGAGKRMGCRGSHPLQYVTAVVLIRAGLPTLLAAVRWSLSLTTSAHCDDGRSDAYPMGFEVGLHLGGRVVASRRERRSPKR